MSRNHVDGFHCRFKLTHTKHVAGKVLTVEGAKKLKCEIARYFVCAGEILQKPGFSARIATSSFEIKRLEDGPDGQRLLAELLTHSTVPGMPLNQPDASRRFSPRTSGPAVQPRRQASELVFAAEPAGNGDRDKVYDLGRFQSDFPARAERHPLHRSIRARGNLRNSPRPWNRSERQAQRSSIGKTTSAIAVDYDDRCLSQSSHRPAPTPILPKHLREIIFQCLVLWQRFSCKIKTTNQNRWKSSIPQVLSRTKNEPVPSKFLKNFIGQRARGPT